MKHSTRTPTTAEAAIKHKVGGLCEVQGCMRPHYGRGLCKAHHQYQWKRGLIPSAKVPVHQKVEEMSQAVTESGCWLWMGGTNNKGYGRIGRGGGESVYAHRASYEAFVGPISDGLEVCHKCDTPSCVNPSHLFLGTHAENMCDASRKGRARTSPKYGICHPNAKFTESDLIRIREGRESAKSIASDLGCNVETVLRVRRGHTYKVAA